MSQHISATHRFLLANYGPLLTLQHVAKIMHSTPNGVRMAIARQQQPFAMALAGAQRKLGRRVYFEARRVADVIDCGTESAQRPFENACDHRACVCDSAAGI